MWGLIPVAGEGSRLRSVTGGAPKCLVEVGGRPLLHHLLDRVGSLCSNVCVVVPPASEDIVAALRLHPAGGSAVTVVQPEPHGLRDAVCRALPEVSAPVLLTMGDSFFASDPASRLDDLAPGQGALLVEPLGEDPGEPAGWVLADSEGMAVRVWKGAQESPDARRIAGAFVLEATALDLLRSGEGKGFESVVHEAVQRGAPYRVLTVPGPRWNVNTPAQLESLRDWARTESREDAFRARG